MFQLHDTTRRRVCLACFAAFGVAPTLLVSAWCLGRRLPGYVEAEAAALSRQLGVTVKLEGMKHLRPGEVLYQGLELVDPETGQTLLRSRLLEVRRRQQVDARGVWRPVLAVIASQPVVEAAAIDRTWRWLQRTLESAPVWLETELQLSAAELTLQASDHSQTLTGVEGLVESLTSGIHAQVLFRLVGAETPEPARIRLVRNRQVSPPSSGFELYTGGGELPCSVLALGLSELRPLGARCRFRGYIWANELPEGWEGEATGQLVELDFGGLVSSHFPHRMSGMGELVIQSARFRHGRLEEGSGLLTAGPGTIDRSLVAAAVERLGMIVEGDFATDDRIAYDQLAFSAVLDAGGLRLQGRCAGVEGGVLLVKGPNRLLSEPSHGPQPIVALVQTLVPQNAVQVPATRQTDWLLRRLPVPDVTPASGARAIPPTARVRLPETWQR